MFSLQRGRGIDQRQQQQQQQKAWSRGDVVRSSVACNQFSDGFIGVVVGLQRAGMDAAVV